MNMKNNTYCINQMKQLQYEHFYIQTLYFLPLSLLKSPFFLVSLNETVSNCSSSPSSRPQESTPGSSPSQLGPDPSASFMYLYSSLQGERIIIHIHVAVSIQITKFMSNYPKVLRMLNTFLAKINFQVKNLCTTCLGGSNYVDSV